MSQHANVWLGKQTKVRRMAFGLAIKSTEMWFSSQQCQVQRYLIVYYLLDSIIDCGIKVLGNIYAYDRS